jgi:hypothetical protein
LRPNTSEYVKLHRWVNAQFPRTGKCEHCGATDRRTEYASKSHARYTKNRADWLELCKSCHRKYDGRIPTEAIASNIGRHPNAATRAKIGAVHRGKVVSAETRAKLSAAAKRKKLSPAHKEKLRQAAMRPKSPETRAKMSAAAYRRYGRTSG